MTLPGRGSRAIGVAGMRYRWIVKPFFDGMRVTVQRAEPRSQLLIVELPVASYYVHRDSHVWEWKPWQEGGKYPEHWDKPYLAPVYRKMENGWVRVQHDVIAPALVESLIVSAHRLGWNPASLMSHPFRMRLTDGNPEQMESTTPAHATRLYEALKRALLSSLFAVGRDVDWRRRLQEASPRNPVELPEAWQLPAAGHEFGHPGMRVPLRAWNDWPADPEDDRFFYLTVGADLDRLLTVRAMLDSAEHLEWHRSRRGS